MANFHTYITKVYYEDTDAGGIVYYAKNLHFIERARTEMIYDRLKLNHKKLKDDFNAIFVVRECNVKYHKSANFEDNLDICTYVSKITRSNNRHIIASRVTCKYISILIH